MHIAHIQGIFSAEHGGPAKSLANYSRNQAAAGHRASVWVLDGFSNSSAAIRLEPPVEMHVCRVDPPERLGGSSEMRRQLRASDSPDIYHLHGAWLRAMHYGAVETRRRQRPCVLELMGMYEPWALRQKWLQKQIVRWWYQDRMLRNAACLHVNSNQEAEYIRQLGFKAPLAVIPVGVDLAEIERLKTDLPAASPWPELNARRFVLFLSRLHPKKGLDLLIRSWAKNQKSEDWMLVIAGTGAQTYVDECRQLATQLGIARQCLWVGRVDEVQKSWLFTHTHCYVLPTSSENFGNTVAEALAHGTPVVTTIHTPWTDLQKYNCGWLVDNTESELSDALGRVMQMPETSLKEMGGRGQSLIREHYSLEFVCRNIMAVYEWVTGKGSKPDSVQLKS